MDQKIKLWLGQRERPIQPLSVLDEKLRAEVRKAFGLPEGVDRYVYPIEGTPTINLDGLKILLHRDYYVREMIFERLPLSNCLNMGCVHLYKARDEMGKVIMKERLANEYEMFYSFRVTLRISPSEDLDIIETYIGEGDACPHNCTSVTRKSLLRFAQSRALSYVLRQILIYGITAEELDDREPVPEVVHQATEKAKPVKTAPPVNGPEKEPEPYPEEAWPSETMSPEPPSAVKSGTESANKAAESVRLVRAIKEALNRFPATGRATGLREASMLPTGEFLHEESLLGVERLWLLFTLERLQNAAKAVKHPVQAPARMPVTTQSSSKAAPTKAPTRAPSNWSEQIRVHCESLGPDGVASVLKTLELKDINDVKTNTERLHLLRALRNADTQEGTHAS